MSTAVPTDGCAGRSRADGRADRCSRCGYRTGPRETRSRQAEGQQDGSCEESGKLEELRILRYIAAERLERFVGITQPEGQEAPKIPL